MRKFVSALLALGVIASPCVVAYDYVVTCKTCGEPCFMGRCPNRDDHYREWKEKQEQSNEKSESGDDDRD